MVTAFDGNDETQFCGFMISNYLNKTNWQRNITICSKNANAHARPHITFISDEFSNLKQLLQMEDQP